jgi:hypothetical protein
MAVFLIVVLLAFSLRFCSGCLSAAADDEQSAFMASLVFFASKDVLRLSFSSDYSNAFRDETSLKVPDFSV